MAFLFKSKKQQERAAAAVKDGNNAINGQPIPQFHSNGQRVGKEVPVSEVRSQATPPSSVNNSLASLGEKTSAGVITPSPEQASSRRMGEVGQSDLPLRNASSNPALSSPSPQTNPNASLYPWSQRRMTYTTSHPSPFPRYGAAVNSVSSKEGDIYMMGGLIDSSTVKGDLWMVEAGAGNMACYPLKTTAEGPGPRVGHASLLVGNAFIVYGGDTKLEDTDVLDETLYLLNTSTRQWSRAVPAGPRPTGRYGHSLNILGSKIYVFGGQVEGYFMNDLVAFDLNQLQVPTNRWEFLIRNSDQGGPPPGQIPPARTNHTVVTYNEKLYLFGGTNGYQWFNDVWSFDPLTNAWTQLDCIGYIPAAREGHAAALVDDVMYIFGGRTEEGSDLGDLAAFRISSRRWYTFQNMGPSPSPRSGHSMTAYGKQVVVLAGEPSSATGVPQDLSLVYVLDTSKIRYPSDQQIQSAPTGDRVPGARRPSAGEKSGMQPNRAIMSPRDGSTPNGQPLQKRLDGVPEQAGPGGNPTIRQVGRPGENGNDMNGIAPGSAQPQAGPAMSSVQLRNGQALIGPPKGPPSGPLPQAHPTMSRSSSTPGVSEPLKPTQGKGFGPALNTDVRSSSKEREPLSDAQNRALSPIKDSPVIKEGPNINGRKSSNSSVAKIIPKQEEHPPVAEFPQPGSRSSSRTRQARGHASIDEKVESSTRIRPSSPPPPVRNGSARKLVSRDSSNRNSQSIVILKELETMRNQNAWLQSELELAKKSGYTTNSSSGPILDGTSSDSFAEADRPLIEALIAMRTELSNVQTSIDQQAVLAAKKIAEVERQRDTAVNEAVYAKAKLAAHGGSSAGSTPQLDGSPRDLGAIHTDRSTDVGRKLAAALETQKGLQHQVEMLTAEVTAEKRARELAEGTASSAQTRMIELEEYRQNNSSEVERLKAELHSVSKGHREQAIACAAAIASVKLLQTDKEELENKHKAVQAAAQDHSETFESLREAMIASGNMRSLLERRLEEEKAEREQLEEKYRTIKVEHDRSTTDIEAMTRRLKDAEELAEQHKLEAESHRQAVMTGFGNVASRAVEPSPDDNGRIAVLLAQVESAAALGRQHQAAADLASEKLRSAEERIAGLEAYQEQVSREGLSIRKQLQVTMRETQSLQASNSEMKHQLANHQLETNAMNVQHNTLKDILIERGVSPGSAATRSQSRGLSSPQNRVDTPEAGRLRELEQQIVAAHAAHEDTKVKQAARAEEADASYRDKLSQLENDYQSAVHYVKGTEKMLKRMKDELSRYKTENARLSSELNESQAVQAKSREVPSDWEIERNTLHEQIDALQNDLTSSHATMEKQISTIREELGKSIQERDLHLNNHATAQQELTQNVNQSRLDLSQLQQENALLETRAMDAEQKVSMLLNQVESSVDNYRRQSRLDMGVSTETKGFGHARQVSDVGSVGGDSTYSSPTKDRNSMALDSLASELETLRTHWETTNKNYRLSSQSHRLSQVFDFERQHGYERPATSTGIGGSPNGAGLGLNTSFPAGIEEEHEGPFSTASSIKSPTSAGGELSSSLADWRKRLDAEEEQARDRKSSD